MNAGATHPWAADFGDLFARAAAELEILHRRRDRVPSRLLSDQQWGILLELFVAEGSGRAMATTALQRAAGTPHSTLVRLVEDLAERGLVARNRSRSDRRITLVRLSPEGRAIVADVLDAAEHEIG